MDFSICAHKVGFRKFSHSQLMYSVKEADEMMIITVEVDGFSDWL